MYEYVEACLCPMCVDRRLERDKGPFKYDGGGPRATFAPRDYYDWTVPLCGVSAKDVTTHFNFNLGNVLKYCWRAGRKDGNTAVDDLRKARDYIDEELKRLGADV